MNKEYKIVVEILVEFEDWEIELDNPNRLAEQYANMATNYASIGAKQAKVLEVMELDE